MATKSISFIEETFEAIDVDVSDSDSWELIVPSDSDDDNFSYDDVTTDTDVVADADSLIRHPYGSPSSDISMQSLAEEADHRRQVLDDTYEIDQNRHVNYEDAVYDALIQIYGINDPYGDEDEKEEDGDEEDEDDYLDLDDELVPRWVNSKFERQRMRKVGKRANPKMNKAKRVANQYNRPGCVHGKHGLGLNHNLIG